MEDEKKVENLEGEELKQVTGGAWGPNWGETEMYCTACGYTCILKKDPGRKVLDCPKCFSIGTFKKK